MNLKKKKKNAKGLKINQEIFYLMTTHICIFMRKPKSFSF